jgi:lysophospholipase L1-like esterase
MRLSIRHFVASLLAASLLALATVSPQANAQTQPGTALTTISIDWQVRNRFRLFRSDKDFEAHVLAHRGGTVLAAERTLEAAAGGRGWARTVSDRLCLDGTGKLVETCERDGEKENYLAPTDYPVRIFLAGGVSGATCAWTFDNGKDAREELTIDCAEDVTMRVPAGRATRAVVDMVPKDGAVQRVETDILVRDLLIAGLGDSIAAGEGNPDKPVALSDDGFCFRRFLGTSMSQYFRPGRSGYRGDRSCETASAPVTAGSSAAAAPQDWIARGARWMNAACHASLYGYQMRTALALAVENPRAAVTFIPLACSGATIADGLMSSQTARECPPRGKCAGKVDGQLAQLQPLLKRAGRGLDLMLLTVGANDVQFSGLVGGVIVEDTTERALSRRGGLVVSTEESDAILKTKLPGDFVKLRASLKPLVGGDLSRVVYVSYGHPALQAAGVACAGGRDGFDVHPALNAAPQRLAEVSDFVSTRFLPEVKSLATCGPGTLCGDPQRDAMTFVDAHQSAFAQHGFCARAESDPEFDRACFSRAGDSFEKDQVAAAESPLACNLSPKDYQPYASRARWVRTANDSYFTAMTYPEGLPALLQPRDIHDAMWGIVSAVYGGAIHPTAEGHAAMADAALPAARTVLQLETPPQVTAETLAPAALPPTATQQ